MPEATPNSPRPELLIAERLGLETLPTNPLCHYTSQLGLVGILKDKAMYATDAAYLNDSQEVVYAVNLARKYFFGIAFLKTSGLRWRLATFSNRRKVWREDCLYTSRLSRKNRTY